MTSLKAVALLELLTGALVRSMRFRSYLWNGTTFCQLRKTRSPDLSVVGQRKLRWVYEQLMLVNEVQ